jgi:hypothetical protein
MRLYEGYQFGLSLSKKNESAGTKWGRGGKTARQRLHVEPDVLTGRTQWAYSHSSYLGTEEDRSDLFHASTAEPVRG